jgi:hypothetical protein
VPVNSDQIARRTDIPEHLSLGVDTAEASVQVDREFLDTDFTWRQAVPVDQHGGQSVPAARSLKIRALIAQTGVESSGRCSVTTAYR